VVSRIFVVLVMVLFLSGCATTNHQSSIKFLQVRMGELEKELVRRDQETQDLRMEVSRLTQEVQRQQRTVVERFKQKEQVTSSGGKGTIRISVSTEKIQKALKSAGNYKGSVDGKIGKATKDAIVSFQKSHGLKADGVVGLKTWVELEAYLE